MAEPENSRETPEERINSFASTLRGIRKASLTYQEMERMTGCPHERLNAAASGTTWPDWKTVEAFAMACGGDLEALRAEWQATNAALGDDAARFRFDPAPAETPPGERDATPGGKRPRRGRRARPVILVLGAALAVAVAVVLITALIPDGGTGPDAGEPGATTAAPGAPSSTRTRPPGSRPSTPENGPGGQDDAPGGDRREPGDPAEPGGTEESTTPEATETQRPFTGEDEDPDRYDSIQEDEVVELVQQQGYNWRDIEYWRHDAATPGEVQIDPHGVFTNLGAKLTIIPDTPLAGRTRCAQATGWRERIEFAELHVGSQLCALSRMDRYASMEVRLLPGSPASDGRFIFYGITWWNP